MFTMRLQGKAPIYEQLGNRITELIISGEMAEGEKLPAVREIAKQLMINPNTVQKTYAELERRGLIYSVPAKGSYVAAKSNYLGELTSTAGKEFEKSVKTALSQGLSAEELCEIVKKCAKGGDEK